MRSFIIMIFFMLSVPFMAMGQEVNEAATAVVDSAVSAAPAAEMIEVGGADISKLIEAIGGLQGGGTLAIIMLVVQLLMWLLQGFFADKAGKYKLVAVMGLTLIAGVVALMMQGMTLGAALLHSTTIASAQVLLNQAYKQFFVKTS